MAPTPKASTAAGARKKDKASKMVTFKLSPKLLKRFNDEPIKVESPFKEDSTSAALVPLPVSTPSTADNPSDPASSTPVASGTPVPSLMLPPTEGVKKKGGKRSSGAAGLVADGVPKVRGKPGPKKKARLEDGTIDHSSTAPRAANGTAHKLGPKANQGAINAGLRALDRSGKPCRKWAKGAFTLKSFTGVVWEIPRWKAPPKFKVEGAMEESASGDSGKENKENSQLESEKSNNAPDIEMGSTESPNVGSPAPSNPVIPTATSTTENITDLGTESASVVVVAAP